MPGYVDRVFGFRYRDAPGEEAVGVAVGTLSRGRTVAARRDSAVLIAFGVAVSVALFVRLALAFEYPLPWGDEAAFLSQAFALARHGTFYVEALNPDRILMWMPPGYMVVTAAVFKLFGYSFALARWLSTALYIGLAWVIVNLTLPPARGLAKLLVLIGSVTFFLSPYVVFIANIARMESLYGLGLMLSLALAIRGRPVIAGSIVAALLTVHLNAGYFLLPYGIFGLICLLRRESPAFARLDIAAVVVALLLLSLYAVFAVIEWPGFVYDMRWQFALKAAWPFMGTALDIAVCAGIAVLAVGQLFYYRRMNRQVWLNLYGACFFFMALYGQTMVYRFGYSLGALLAMASLAAAIPALSHRASRVASFAACLFLLWHMGNLATVPAPNTAPVVTLAHKRIISRGDLKMVHRFIRGLPAGSTVSFAYQFDGIEPFFFNDFDASGARWMMHTHGATVADPRRSADWRITCDSSLYAPMISPYFDSDYKRVGADTGCRITRWMHANPP